VLSGLDFVTVEVEVQEILQGLSVAEKSTSTCVYLELVFQSDNILNEVEWGLGWWEKKVCTD
jgi:hypothetical protein